MSDDKPSDRLPVGSIGHVSVRLGHMHPQEVRFSFESPAPRMSSSLGSSLLIHAGILAAIYFLMLAPSAPIDLRPTTVKQVVWIEQPGPGGGGGGGGNRMKTPPPKEVSIPKQKPPEIKPVVLTENSVPLPDFLVPAKSLDEAAPTTGGSGTGGGTGTGTGTGIGNGSGSGIGDGWGGGTGGGAYRPGSGIENPVLRREVKPQYTADAMRAKIQGTVYLDCVVKADGRVGECGVTRSLDSTFGLDQRAVEAAKQWVFLPGKRLGVPVPVLVSIELTFTLR